MTFKKQLGEVLMYKLTRSKYQFSAFLREKKKWLQRTALLVFIKSIMYVSEAV